MTIEDTVAFDAVLRRRIRDQHAIDGHRREATGASLKPAPGIGANAKRPLPPPATHTIGQSGCFCLDCLLHRKQEWRIGDVNPMIVGPRDRWRQWTWGSAERGALGAVDPDAASLAPVETPVVRERIRVHDSKKRTLTIEREAKFTAVASGKYHTLMLSESRQVFACGDNSYGALGREVSTVPVETPMPVENGIAELAGGSVQMIAASAFASFAVVVLPQNASNEPTQRQKPMEKRDRKNSLVRRKSIEQLTKNGDVVVNYGHGDEESSSTPRMISFFNTMRVLQVSAGSQHVLVLTDVNGLFAFGDGADGKLGVGDTEPRSTPTRVVGLEGLDVVQVSAGAEHSIAVTGDTIFNRQVYSWGLGTHGRLGHNDELSRTKPTRISHFRGRKVIHVVAGGAHNLATSEMSDGVCVWSWGHGRYGQLGHRETWDAWLPRSVDEIRRERIQFIDAGERHSIALSESHQLWVWGKGVHGTPDVAHPDPASTSIVQPINVKLPGIQLVSVRAGRDRTFVWGDRVIDAARPSRLFGGSSVTATCCALPEFESLTSDCFRIIFRCGYCHLDEVCIACGHKCHLQHCLELVWTLEDTLSRHCNCFSSGKCLFDMERGVDIGADDFDR